MGAIFIAAGGLAVWSFATNRFVANAAGTCVALTVGLALGAVAGLLTFVDPFYQRNTPERAARLAAAPALANPVNRLVLIGLMTGYCGFEAVRGTVLEVWTFTTGHPAEQVMHLGVYSGSSKGNCPGFSLQEAPFSLHRVVCVRYEQDEQAPLPGTPIVIQGHASSVGISVESFQIAPRRFRS